MNKEIENNQVTLSGEIVSNFEFSHKCYGEGFYKAMIESKRKSNQKDIIPVIVSDRLVDVEADWTGRIIKVSGQFRSNNKWEKDKKKLILSVFATEFQEKENERLSDKNRISLDGYICKKPSYRETPLGREISDVLLAVNRPYGKSDYIPCVFWSRNAKFASLLEVGTRVNIEGRIQSREYIKRMEDSEPEKRIAYEVSVGKLEVVEDEQSKD